MGVIASEIISYAVKYHALLSGKHRAAVIGVSGPQGSGKTTATKEAASILNQQGLRTIALSLDDFYYPSSEQNRIASLGNSLLQQRGLPGTHDVDLMSTTLLALINQKPVQIPQYDKSLREGRGDRIESILVREPFDIVIFEGWCVGFQAVDSENLKSIQRMGKWASRHPIKDLDEVNKHLADYSKIWILLDVLIYLEAESIEYVYTWRRTQEEKLRRKEGRGMSDDAVAAFVDQYMPAYEVYAATVMPERAFKLALDWTPTLKEES